jgi:glycosyltransferase involved in cell wall biosynthesis
VLSILIPVYNYDVREFVTELRRQALQCDIPFEIRCYDDASAGKYQLVNRELEQLDAVVYVELPVNIGRSAIRNQLAKDAIYPYLLFLDCDSFPEYGDFVQRYVSALEPATLLCGGRTYTPRPPEDKQYLLRWSYGSAREVFSVQQRRQKCYHCFQTNNFVVPRELFISIGLNEGLKGYGHEDTQFGQQLMARTVPVQHIDNPLRHLGLETTEEFLRKTDEGIVNLYYLIDHGYDVSTIKLARYYRWLRNLRLAGLTGRVLQVFEKSLLKNLNASRPGLLQFDLYKLNKLIQIARQHNKMG